MEQEHKLVIFWDDFKALQMLDTSYPELDKFIESSLERWGYEDEAKKARQQLRKWHNQRMYGN